MADAMLQQALNFTDDDLAANRAGRLGPSQRGRNTGSATGRMTKFAVAGVFIVGVLLTVAFILPQYVPASRGFLQFVPVIVLIAIAVVLERFLAYLRRRRQTPQADQRVLSVEGAIARTTTTPMSGTGVLPEYRMSIGPMTFAFAGPEPMRPFVDGTRYRGYYLPGTAPTLLSAEPA
jgi:hypothetical protein